MAKNAFYYTFIRLDSVRWDLVQFSWFYPIFCCSVCSHKFAKSILQHEKNSIKMDFSFISAWQDANQNISLRPFWLSADFSVSVQNSGQATKCTSNINITRNDLTIQKLNYRMFVALPFLSGFQIRQILGILHLLRNEFMGKPIVMCL